MDKMKERNELMEAEYKIMIQMTDNEKRQIKDCMSSKLKPLFLLNVVSSAAVAAAVPIKNSNYAALKRLGVGSFCCFLGTIFSELFAMNMCYPLYNKIKDDVIKRNAEEAGASDASSESREHEQKTVMDTQYGANLDISSPASWSLDHSSTPESSFGDKNYDVEISEPKPITYDELRLRSRRFLNESVRTTESKKEDRRIRENETDIGLSNTEQKKSYNIYGDAWD